MKSDYLRVKKDNRAVFGLTSVQAFFAIILGVALLAYVIVIIMGTLTNTTILPTGGVARSVVNETGIVLTGTPDAVATASAPGFTGLAVSLAFNTSAVTQLVNAANMSVASNGYITNGTAYLWQAVTVTYTYSEDSIARAQSSQILGNTSQGVTGFFSAINPVYAILAILVIILVLVVLVRVVAGGGAGGLTGRVAANPQL